MKLAIIGSRKFNDYEQLRDVAAQYPATEIVSSGARGTDMLAEKYAQQTGLPLKLFLPKFKTDKVPYHVRWFHVRNRELAEYADLILAFWNSKSSGTKSTIRYARKLGKPIVVIPF